MDLRFIPIHVPRRNNADELAMTMVDRVIGHALEIVDNDDSSNEFIAVAVEGFAQAYCQ